MLVEDLNLRYSFGRGTEAGKKKNDVRSHTKAIEPGGAKDKVKF